MLTPQVYPLEVGVCVRVWVVIALSGVLLLHGCVPPETPSAAIVSRTGHLRGNQGGEPMFPEVPGLPQVAFMDKAAFAQELMTEVQMSRPGWLVLNHGDEVLELWQGKVAGPTLPVGPVYAEYRRRPDNRVQVLSGAVRRAFELFDSARTWDVIQQKIFPRLISVESYQSLVDLGALPVSIKLSNQVFVVFDLRVDGQSYLVHQGLRVTWNRSLGDIFTEAVTNLSRVAPPLVQGKDGIWRFEGNQGNEAVGILLLDRFVQLAGQVEGPLVIAIPSQDRLYAFDGGDGEVVLQMHGATKDEYARAVKPLSREWLVIKDGRIVVYSGSKS